MDDRDLARKVAVRKGTFFPEKQNGKTISYQEAVTGSLRLVPDGDALALLERDYNAMVEDGLFLGDAPTFAALMGGCA